MKLIFSIALVTITSYNLAQAKPTFDSPVRIHSEGQPISIPYGYSFPVSIDLDKDGLKDIVVGEYRKKGEIYFYKNTGSIEAPVYAKAQNLMIGEEVLTVPGIGN